MKWALKEKEEETAVNTVNARESKENYKIKKKKKKIFSCETYTIGLNFNILFIFSLIK